MANTAFGHDATLTTPGSTTNTALVRWANTSGNSLGNTANILSDGSNITLNARGEVRFADADSSHYIALEAPATVSTTYTMALPAAVPSANDYLKVTSYSGGAGVLEWATAGGALTPWTSDIDTDGYDLITNDSNEDINIIPHGTGKVGIKTDTPEVPFHVQKGDSGLAPYANAIAFFESSTAEAYIQLNGASDATGGIFFGNAGGSATAAQLLMHPGQVDIRIGGDLEFRVASNGNISGTHGTYHTSSDERVKENIVNSDVGLDILKQMRPVKFNFLEARRLGTQTRIGFIAQEIESLVPEVVHTADTPDGDILDMKAIEDMQLLPILVKAIQELNAKIDAL